MRHRKSGRKLGRTSAHRRAMLRNLVCSLFSLETEGDAPRRVTTTLPKAKEARRFAERLITLGKRGTLHARRRALSLLQNKGAVKLLFEKIAPLYNGRNGGYTRILRLPKWRLGDGADLCYFELVTGEVEPKAKEQEPLAPAITTTEPATGAPDEAADDEETDEPEADEASGDDGTAPKSDG